MKRGFSLVEFLVTMAIVTAVSIPALGLLTENGRHVTFNEDNTNARILARQIIERYRLEVFHDLQTQFSSYEAGANTIEEDPILSGMHFVKNFKREGRFEEILPNLAGTFICRISWIVGKQEKTYVAQTVFRNREYHHGK